MPWSHEFDEEIGFVELTFAGQTSTKDLQDATSALIALEKEKDVLLFLVNATTMTFAPDVSFADLLSLPAEQYVDEKADRLGRLAIIEPSSPEAQKGAAFFETACINRGWSVKLFSNRHDALEWLT